MAQGKAGTKYRVVIYKCEEGNLPIIIPHAVGKKTYEHILALILKTQGIKTGELQR